jgi:sugar lactone lactonase YvrE
MARITAAAVVVAAVLGSVALAAVGGIVQPAGKAGCISEDGAGPCADGHNLAPGVDAVTVSPDGRDLYATTFSGVARFDRRPSNGALVQPAGRSGCVSETGAGRCADGYMLKKGADSVAVSPDGKYVYVAAYTSSAITTFKRNRHTGAIKQLTGAKYCVSESGSGPCAKGHGMDGVAWLIVSADGTSIYAAATKSNAIVRLTRNEATGAIAQPGGAEGCVSDGGAESCAAGHALLDSVYVAESPDGRNLYVAALMSHAVSVLTRDPATGAIAQPAGTDGCVSADAAGPCQQGHGIAGPFAVAVSDDGRSVYSASTDDSAVARFDRDQATGALVQPAGLDGCVSEDGSGSCADGHGLSGADAVAVSPGGANVYVVGASSVATFTRDPASGAMTQASGVDGCVSEDASGPCADGRGLAGGYAVAVSPDARSVYSVALDSAAIARFVRSP